MRRAFSLTLFPALAFAQITGVRVAGVTSTQAVIAYTAPDQNACTLEISESPSYSPAVNDVNTSLFPGANSDSRTENVVTGRQRVFVAGKQTTGLSGDRWYSRALQADTTHYFRVTCGEHAATGTFKTANIPLGNSRGFAPPVDPENPGRYALHTINGMARNESFADPATGAQIRRVSMPHDYRTPSGDDSIYDRLCSNASGANWTTPAAACSDTDGGAEAVYNGSSCGATCDWLALTASTNFYNVAGVSLQYIRSKLTGSGTASSAADRTVEICITLTGTTCASEIKEVVLDQTTSTKTACRSVPCVSEPTSVDTWRPLKDDQIGITEIDVDRCGDCAWGFLVRKKTPAGTIRIRDHKFDAVTSNEAGMSRAGSHDRCSNALSSGGYHYCTGVGPGANTLHSVNPDTGQTHFLGRLKGPGFHDYVMHDSSSFDSMDPKTLYAQFFYSDAIYRGTFIGNETEDAAPSAIAPMSWTNLTPGGGINSLIAAFNGAFDPAKFTCRMIAKQNEHLLIQCRRGNQQSYGWLAAFSLATNTIVAAMPTYSRPAHRWSGIHTVNPMGDQDVLYVTSAELSGQQPGIGPYKVRLVSGVNSTVQTFDVTSDAASPNTGEPYSAFDDNYLMDAAAGDVFSIGNEWVKITARSRLNSTTVRWTVQRGFNNSTAASHNANSELTARGSGPCGYNNPAVCATGPNELVWRYLEDPHGTDATASKTWRNQYIGHMSARKNLIVGQQYFVTDAGNAYAAYSGFFLNNAPVAASPTFAGIHAPAAGNAYQSYPSCDQTASETRLTWFTDKRGFHGGNLFECGSGDSPPCGWAGSCNPNTSGDLSGHCPAVRVGGANCGGNSPSTCDTYRYYANSLLAIRPKHHPTVAICGTKPLNDISGPGSIINDATPYSYCIAQAVGECRSESTAGSVYVSCPGISYFGCSGGDHYTGASDVCAGNLSAVHGVTQIRPGKSGPGGESDFGNSRNLTSLNLRYRVGGVAAKSLPNGKWHLTDINWGDRMDLFLIKTPPFPVKDSINRQTFITVPVQLKPPAELGVHNAIVEFGYSPDFHCTSRAEKCVANSSAVSEAQPFVWPAEAGGEANVSGVVCSNGCTVAIPAYPNKVLYYRWVYRDAANGVIARSATLVTAVP